MKLTFATFLFIASYVYLVQGSYYWQDYFGTIPPDAVKAGTSIDGKNVYIGQAYLKNWGIIVVEINPGVKEVYVPMHGLQKTDKYIKILCGPQENFYWLTVDHTHIHLEENEKQAVIGGHEDNYGNMSIGRINYSGATKIGKVNTFLPEKAYFYFNADGQEREVTSYQLLMYNNTESSLNNAV